jgi:hypothetical protein
MHKKRRIQADASSNRHSIAQVLLQLELLGNAQRVKRQLIEATWDTAHLQVHRLMQVTLNQQQGVPGQQHQHQQCTS